MNLDFASNTPEKPTQPLRTFFVRGLLFLYVIVASLFLLFKWVVFPQVQRFEPQIQTYLEQRLEQPVSFQDLKVEFIGFTPVITVRDFVLGQRNVAETLTAQHVLAEISLRSVLSRQIQFKNLELINPVLKVVYSNSTWMVAGIPIRFDHQTPEDNVLINFLVHQGRLLISEGQVDFQFTDKHGNLAYKQFNALQGQWTTSGEKARLQLELITEGLQQPLQLNADLNRSVGPVEDPTSWSGSVYLNIKSNQPGRWFAPFKLNNWPLFGNWPAVRQWPEQLDTEIWLTVQAGQLQRSTGFIDLKNASIQSFKQPENDLIIEQFRTWLFLNQIDFGKGYVQAQFKQLQARLAEDSTAVIDVGPFNGEFRRLQQHGKPLFQAHLDELDVQNALQLAKQIAATPWFNPELALWLSNFEASGFIESFSLSFLEKHAEGNFFDRWSIEGGLQFQRLTLLKNSTEGDSPQGFKNVSGQISGNSLAGQWSIEGNNSQIVSAALFDQTTIALTRLAGEGMWRRQTDKEQSLDLMINRLVLENDDAQATVLGTYHLRTGTSDLIHLSGQIARAKATAVPHYLPKVIGLPVRNWLKNNLKSGESNNSQFLVHGPVNEFPFHENPSAGQFHFEIPVNNLAMTFAPDWPLVENIHGLVTIDRKSLQVKAKQAKTGQIELTQVFAYIENLAAHKPVLEIQGQGQGFLQKMVEYTKNSPVSFYSGGVFEAALAEGKATLMLNLDIPIFDASQTQVSGQLLLQNNSVQLIPSMPWIHQLRGPISFSNKGVEFSKLTGMSLGSKITLQGEQNEKGYLRVSAQGVATAQALGDYLNPLLSTYLQGQTPFTVEVNAGQGQPDILIQSRLEGLSINLPTPFKKQAITSMNFRLTRSNNPSGQIWRASLTGSGYPAAQVSAQVSQQTGQLQYLSAGVGATMPGIQQAIRLNLAVDQLNVLAWRDAINDMLGRIEDKTIQLSGLLPKLLRGTQEASLPLDLQLATNRLVLAGKPFQAMKLRVRSLADELQFTVNSNEVTGFFSWEKTLSKPQGLITGRFSRLVIPETLKSDVRNLIREPMKSIPALDLQIDQFELGQVALGALNLRAENQPVSEQIKATLANQPATWTLTHFELSNPESVTTAVGKWQYGPNQSQQKTEITIEQRISDAGKLLARLGRKDVFLGGEAQIQGTLSWANAPSEFDLKTLTGSFQVTSQNGQFLKANPGVAKLLGVLSLQGLTRRLSFDFKDLFGQGFAYNDLTANFLIKEGVATTENLRMIGPSATVVMDGQLNLHEETQNLNVLVLPDLNATGGSLLYSLIVANPAVGIASLIADAVLKDPLSKVFSLQYKVTGSWVEPNLERINLPNSKNQEAVDNSS